MNGRDLSVEPRYQETPGEKAIRIWSMIMLLALLCVHALNLFPTLFASFFCFDSRISWATWGCVVRMVSTALLPMIFPGGGALLMLKRRYLLGLTVAAVPVLILGLGNVMGWWTGPFFFPLWLFFMK